MRIIKKEEIKRKAYHFLIDFWNCFVFIFVFLASILLFFNSLNYKSFYIAIKMVVKKELFTIFLVSLDVSIIYGLFVQVIFKEKRK